MVIDDVLEGVGLETVARKQIDKFAEREATEVVALHNTIKLRILILQAHHTASSKYNLQVGVEVVTFTEFRTPVWLLEYLVDQQHTATMLIELISKLRNTVTLEIEIVHVDIQTLTVVDIKLFFSVLKEEGGLSDATRALNADHAVAPVNLIHEGAANWCINMLYKVSVRPEKSFHS